MQLVDDFRLFHSLPFTLSENRDDLYKSNKTFVALSISVIIYNHSFLTLLKKQNMYQLYFEVNSLRYHFRILTTLFFLNYDFQFKLSFGLRQTLIDYKTLISVKLSIKQ